MLRAYKACTFCITRIYKILDLLNQQGKITFSALDIMCTHTERIPYKAVTTYEQNNGRDKNTSTM